jgi:hypothetical protein
MWLRGERATAPMVCDGDSFRRLHSPGVTETAKVIAVACDGSGISHVQFNLEFENRGERALERRTLALDHFRSLYPEAIATDARAIGRK